MTKPAHPSSPPLGIHQEDTTVMAPIRDNEMAVSIRDMDWSATPLGGFREWPQALFTLVDVILGSNQPMFVVWGAAHTLLYNDAYAQILASKHPSALGRSFLDVWDEIKDDLIPIVETAYDGLAVSMEDITLLMRRKGYEEETHFTFSYTPVRGNGGNIDGFFCACMEITAQVFAKRDQQRAEEALRELNETLEQQIQHRTLELARLWELSPDLMGVIDFQGFFLRVNPAWTTLLGYLPDELIGHHVNEFVIPDDHANTVEAYTLAANGGLPRIVNRYRHKNGSLRWISWVAAPSRDVTYANGRDITLEKEQADALVHAEEALRQAQKLEAIGQLTGGVAHDFNNLLTVVKSSVDMLKRPDMPEMRRSRYVSAISDAVDRAAKLTAQLLAFARRQALNPEVFDACDSVRSLSSMMETLVGPLIEIVMRLPEKRCFVEADRSQFDTALVNMTVNARDAFEGRGRLTICVESADELPAEISRESTLGSFVAVTITGTPWEFRRGDDYRHWRWHRSRAPPANFRALFHH
ncbi:PAS domain-containing sensor histidine kinase [Pseudomonas savastanoi]|uniref:hybrid sensor histidine kinase/response regulator n=1 Tax=Pseudomonas savastanoi TaxID=29438 RepID=UPI001F2BF6B6|nr:PAS domain-containing sensor histidine kinase [Pseudomonas savastanoi]